MTDSRDEEADAKACAEATEKYVQRRIQQALASANEQIANLQRERDEWRFRAETAEASADRLQQENERLIH